MKFRPARTYAVALLCATVVFACESAEQDDRLAGTAGSAPVVVFAAFEDENYLPGLLDGFTNATGVPVIVRNGLPMAIVDDLIANTIQPPADLLWAPSIVGVWRAADEGALRPLQSASVISKVAPWLRDPDGYWVSLSYQKAVIVYDPSKFAAADMAGFAELADPGFRDQLCLSASSRPINLAVIAMLLDALSMRPTEIAVRGWVANLARPVFADDGTLLQALEAGSCGVGIVSSAALLREHRDGSGAGLAVFVPDGTYAEVEAVGIGRHARNPAGALALLDWLLLPATQSRHAAAHDAYPANISVALEDERDAASAADVMQKNVAVAAWQRAEALKLAERARYR